jgi:hypothetical protein
MADITLELIGVQTPPAPETRDIAFLNVTYKGNTYPNWAIYIPQFAPVGESLATAEANVAAQIDAREAQWAAAPKTVDDIDNMTGQPRTRDVAKEEIVKPYMPDYYALRRAEYPSIGDQLGAIGKGIDSAEYQDIVAKINAVKAKYPKTY